MSKKKLGRDLGSLLSGFDKKATNASDGYKEVLGEKTDKGWTEKGVSTGGSN